MELLVLTIKSRNLLRIKSQGIVVNNEKGKAHYFVVESSKINAVNEKLDELRAKLLCFSSLIACGAVCIAGMDDGSNQGLGSMFDDLSRDLDVIIGHLSPTAND